MPIMRAPGAARRSPAAVAALAAKKSEQVKAKGLEPEGLQTYLDFFKYGAPAHGGFGMGLLRVLMLLLHQPNIREVGFLFRGPNRLEP